MLHRRYSSASSSTPALLEVVEDREAYANHYGLGPYSGGEVFPCVPSRLVDSQGVSVSEAKEGLFLSEGGEEKAVEDVDKDSPNTGSRENSSLLSARDKRPTPACLGKKGIAEEEECETDKRESIEVGEALLKAAFAAVVLGEDEFLVPLLEEVAT